MPKYHEDHVKGWDGDLKSLARAICDLKYDKTAEFIQELAKALEEDEKADLERGRVKLSTRLGQAANALHRAHTKMIKVWEVCEPFMKKKNV